MQSTRQITIGHTPDADDAFMFYALTVGKLTSPNFAIEHTLTSIQELNQAARIGTYEMSAISFAAYPDVADRYYLMPCGACMGLKRGPILVAKRKMDPNDLSKIKVAIPGKLTTAYLTLKIFEPNVNVIEKPFNQILQSVIDEEVDAGLLINESQLTFQELGLEKIVDLGQWWFEETGLPLPLGGNVIRKDLGATVIAEMTGLFKDSIKYALSNKEEAVQYAKRYAANMTDEQASKFIGMYVNDLTIDYGETGRTALKILFDKAHKSGALTRSASIQFALTP
jgi:1,4-dihydroxy-6-naphthoate synthase